MKDEIMKALLDWNPWLIGRFPTELRGFSRDYPILDYAELEEIKILEGARRVGKSTLFYQVIEHLLNQGQQILYINFDDEDLRRYSLKTIMNVFSEKQAFSCLFIDEIQHCSEWVHHLRNIYDRKELKQIWISGSNSTLKKNEYKTLLSGRNITIPIYPLSFKEYLLFQRCEFSSDLISNKKSIEIKQHFENYLMYGSFPAIALRKILKKEFLINYFEDFIYKDIASRYSVNTTKLKDLGIYLASNSAKIVSYRNIAQSLKLHVNTITDYISYFQDIFLFDELYKFDYSLKTQFGSDKKPYCLDTGLAAAISFRFSNDRGRLLENLVFNELKRRGQERYFHKHKKECDFLVKENLDITQLIQVCDHLSDPETKQREIQGLIDAMQLYPDANALILTSDESGHEKITCQGKKSRLRDYSYMEMVDEALDLFNSHYKEYY